MANKSCDLKFENLGSLITYKKDDKEYALGYLIHFDGRGTFEPSLGRVDIEKRDADIHNKCLDEALIKGLDEHCEIGQGNSFYVAHDDLKRTVIKTFCGTVVAGSRDIERNGVSLTFYRGGKKYRGRVSKEHDLFNFRRVK